jgi:hypothetical protein
MLPRPFVLKLYPYCPIGEEAAERLPPHQLVIEPLLQAASEVVVHQTRGHTFSAAVPPHVKRRNALVLVNDAALVRDWPRYWNASAWERGTISIRVDVERVNWPALFSVTEYVGVWASRYQQLKGSPAGAVNYADKHARDGDAVFSLSASNGVEDLDVWVPPEQMEELNRRANESCIRFVRWIEQGKYPNEIIYNRPPYATAV